MDCVAEIRDPGRCLLRDRLSMNDPPTALVGFGTGSRQPRCRLSMNDPPTALVGFRRSSRVAAQLAAKTTKPQKKYTKHSLNPGLFECWVRTLCF